MTTPSASVLRSESMVQRLASPHAASAPVCGETNPMRSARPDCASTRPGKCPATATAASWPSTRRRGRWSIMTVSFQWLPGELRPAAKNCIAAEYGVSADFCVANEVLGGRGTPLVQRVLRRKVACRPSHPRGNEINLCGVLGERSPRVAHVVKVVRAEHVATGAPTFAVAAPAHLLRAEAHLVHARHIPGAVVPTTRGALHIGHEVVVGAVARVIEGHNVERSIRKPEAERFAAERGGPLDVGREEHHMRKALGMDRLDPAALDDPSLACAACVHGLR